MKHSAPGADGSLITIGGRVYTRGLGTYAGSRIRYYLGGRCSSLSVDVGIDDATSIGSASFALLADDRVAAESGLVTAAEGARRLTADLTGATWLELVAEPDADSSTDDQADWAAPELVCGGSTEPTAPERTLFSFETGTESFTIANPNDGGTMTQSGAFHADGEQGLQVVSPVDGNWFGRAFAEPLDLRGMSRLKFDVSTAAEGTPGEIAIQVGPDFSWCQGGN